MAENEYMKPTWSYPDSMGPAIYYGHVPEFNGLIPPYKGRQTTGVGSKAVVSMAVVSKAVGSKAEHPELVAV